MLVAAVRPPWVIRGWPPAAGALFSVPSFDERILFSSVSIRVHPWLNFFYSIDTAAALWHEIRSEVLAGEIPSFFL
jgi:hypothetical protein